MAAPEVQYIADILHAVRTLCTVISTCIPKETEEKRKNHSLAPWLPKEFIFLWQCAYDQHGSRISLIKATSAATDVISHNRKTVMHYQRRKLNFLILMIEVFHSTKPSVPCLYFLLTQTCSRCTALLVVKILKSFYIQLEVSFLSLGSLHADEMHQESSVLQEP